jgi:hypothetical protein
MFIIRNIGGIAQLLFGSTFLWLTPSFASRSVSLGSDVVRHRCPSSAGGCRLHRRYLGLFTNAGWCELAAVASAALGVVVLVPYWLAASHGGEHRPLRPPADARARAMGPCPCHRGRLNSWRNGS